jgi:hypothetical protein
VRQNSRIVSVAVTVAVGVNSDGRHEVLGMAIGPSEAEVFWTDFLRGLARRGLRGVKLIISDAHEGIKASVSRVFSATWQRCHVHFSRNALAHAGKSGRRVVVDFIATAFAQETVETAKVQWHKVADQLRPTVPKLATLMDTAEEDVLAYMSFPPQHRTKPHSTNPLERLMTSVRGWAYTSAFIADSMGFPQRRPHQAHSLCKACPSSAWSLTLGACYFPSCGSQLNGYGENAGKSGGEEVSQCSPTRLENYLPVSQEECAPAGRRV